MNAQVSFQGFILRPAPEVRWYLEFSPGFTAMSLFVPLVACWAAFYFLGNQDELKVWRICLAGVMCGGMSMSRPFQVIGRPVEEADTCDVRIPSRLDALFRFVPATSLQCGLQGKSPDAVVHHLLGEQPPDSDTDPSDALIQAYTIVLAILVAMIATTVAFFTFFRLRAHWQDNFLKRTACALVLAIAVCGESY